MWLGTLGARLLGNILAGKRMNKAGEEFRRPGYRSSIKIIDFNQNHWFFMPPHPLTYFEVQNYYQNELKFNGVYSRNNLPDKIKNRTYLINLDEYSDIGTHWIALYSLNSNVTYFDSFWCSTHSKRN